MQAVEFMSEITEHGELSVPRQLAENLPHAKKVRVDARLFIFSSHLDRAHFFADAEGFHAR